MQLGQESNYFSKHDFEHKLNYKILLHYLKLRILVRNLLDESFQSLSLLPVHVIAQSLSECIHVRIKL